MKEVRLCPKDRSYSLEHGCGYDDARQIKGVRNIITILAAPLTRAMQYATEVGVPVEGLRNIAPKMVGGEYQDNYKYYFFKYLFIIGDK